MLRKNRPVRLFALIWGKRADCLTFFTTKHILNRSSPLILCLVRGRETVVPKSVLEAIKMGIWDYEPRAVESGQYDPADAMPGTEEKLTILAERAQRGLPLWHSSDRDDAESPPPDKLRRKPR
jgi:hypothetical protein